MHTKSLFALSAAVSSLTANQLCAEEAKPEMKCACMKDQAAKKQEVGKEVQSMEDKTKAEAREAHTNKMAQGFKIIPFIL